MVEDVEDVFFADGGVGRAADEVDYRVEAAADQGDVFVGFQADLQEHFDQVVGVGAHDFAADLGLGYAVDD